MTNPEWNELAAKELRGKDPDDLVITTPEGIDVKPLYTAEDTLHLEKELPGKVRR
jgi:methylmalonyl-CoA mutase